MTVAVAVAGATAEGEAGADARGDAGADAGDVVGAGVGVGAEARGEAGGEANSNGAVPAGDPLRSSRPLLEPGQTLPGAADADTDAVADTLTDTATDTATVSPSPNPAWADLVCRVLVAGGVSHFNLAPGSRSAPLAVAASRCGGLRTWVHLDERAAAFFALGQARMTDQPVAVLATSGTAGAHFLPAAIEAAEAGIPLILVTADRTPDVRHFGAAQTIDQRDLFGRFAAESADLPVPSASPAAARRMAAQVADALALARSRRMPVHLNCPFDEPLHPAGAGSLAQLAEIPAVWPAEAFASEFGIQEAARALNQAQRPLIVAGPEAASPLDALAVLDLGRVSGAPIAADVASGLRYRSPRGAAVLAASDAIFGAPGVARLGPDLVISLGLVPTSKALNAYLAHHAPPVVRLQSGLRRRDPDALALRTVDGNIGDACRRLAAAVSGFPREPRWQRAFQAAGAAARASLDDLDRTGGLSLEAAASRAALAAMPPGSVAMFSNSLPVRYGDLVCDAAREGVRILANRGANGIDGITSTALGAAAVSGKPLLLVIGDVAFLHDLGGLYAMRHARAPVVILLLDNDGGGIFSLLPIAGHPEVCEPLCATPHGLAPEHAAALHGTRFHSCRSASDVSKAVESACQARSGHLLVVKTDRQENAAGYRSALAAMRERVQRAAGALFEEVPA